MPGDYDMAALHAAMSESFEGDSPAGGRVEAPAAAPAPVPEGAPSSEAPAGVPQAEWDALPKSWKQDYKDHWGKIDPTVRQYIYERERQAVDGITQYKRGHEAWSKVTNDFQDLMKEHPQADFAEIARATVANHVKMLQADPATRVQYALELASGYGVSPQELLQAMHQQSQTPAGGGSPGDPGFTPQQMQALRQMLGPLAQAVQHTTGFVQNSQAEATRKSIDAFFSNPENAFAEELGNDILEIVKKEGIRDLNTAYQLALMRNPEVRGKWLVAQTKKLNAPPPAAPTNLKATAPAAPPATPGDMDATMASVIQKHYG